MNTDIYKQWTVAYLVDLNRCVHPRRRVLPKKRIQSCTPPPKANKFTPNKFQGHRSGAGLTGHSLTIQHTKLTVIIIIFSLTSQQPGIHLFISTHLVIIIIIIIIYLHGATCLAH